MTKYSLSDAIRLSGVSRQTFYATYVNHNKITVETDDFGRRTVDLSEIQRVFGEVDLSVLEKVPVDKHPQRLTNYNPRNVSSLEAELKAYREQIADLKELLAKGDQRESELRQIISNLTLPR